MESGSNGVMKVRTTSRSTGGVAMIDNSRTPVMASCSVRGIGVAREGQHVHIRLERLQPLLVGDAEMLLLVHDQQAEILERDGLGEQGMGADHDVDGARREPGPGLLHVGGRDEAGELGHLNG